MVEDYGEVKYEEVYLKAYSSVTDAKKQLSAY